MDDIIVIGAGAAGLMAANELASRGLSVTMIEARDRVGGRICSLETGSAPFPIETGAEFVHGRVNDVWDIAKRAELATHEVPDRHWRRGRKGLIETRSFWEELAVVLDKIPPDADPRRDFLSWLESRSEFSSEDKQRALRYVEGFHAAKADQVSLRSLGRSHETSKKSGGDAAFRITAGYSAIPGWLLAQALSLRARLVLGTTVQVLRWKSGEVHVEAVTAAGARSFRAKRAIITLPVGVLRSGSVRFEPPLRDKLNAVESLGIGQVVKVGLLFRSRFWPVDNFGYIHSQEEWLPTWWADERGLLLTGWSGGPRAEVLMHESDESIRQEAVRTLGRIFEVTTATVERELILFHRHNWAGDPFSLGAYTYTTAGNLDAPQRLSESIESTLFFAGEATDIHGEQGTVHAALASGRRAAGEVLRACDLADDENE